MPPISCLCRTVQRIRQHSNPQLVNPSCLEDLVLPDHYKITNNGEPFLMFDSGGKNRYLIFTTIKNLDYLSSCKHWFADETFRSVPNIFMQLYTIHGYCSKKVIPLIFILAPNKRRTTYKAILSKLNEIEPRLNPEIVMIDFEINFIKPVERCFPNVHISGCHFHFAQSVFRYVQSAGLQDSHANDSEFVMAIKMLIGLSCVPVNDVSKIYCKLLNAEYFVENHDLLKPIIEYFEHI